MCHECLRDIVPVPVARRPPEMGLLSFPPLGHRCPAPHGHSEALQEVHPSVHPGPAVPEPSRHGASPGTHPAPCVEGGAESWGRPFVSPSSSGSS